MKTYKYLAIIILGVVVFGTLSFYITQLPAKIIPSAKATTLQNILASICASFAFLFTFEAGNHLNYTFHHRRFRAFFGDLSTSIMAYFVYPDFVLSEQCRELLKDIPVTSIFRKSAGHYPGSRFIDVPKIVASNDLQAVVIMATKMGQYLGDSPRLISDGQAVDDHSTKTLISFGLTSNAMTDLYQSKDSTPLFTINDPGGNPEIVVNDNGTQKRYGRTADLQHGLILRYKPNPRDYPNQFWFICAGLGAAGTPAAAWNLAHNWRRYYRRFKKHDFLIIFSTSNDVHAYTSSNEVSHILR